MAAPVYIITYNGDQFPGYVQSDSEPLAFRHSPQNVLNRNGGILTAHGTELRRVNLQFIAFSTLTTGSGLDHVNNLKSQYAVAADIVAQATGMAPLTVGDATKYLSAFPVGISTELTAGINRTLRYTVEFVAEPYYLAATPITNTFSGNGTVTLTMPATLTTYPKFTIPSGVTAFTATHTPSGKVLNFLRGTFTGELVIDCADFSAIKSSNGNDASASIQNVNFGIKHTTGAGSFSMSITNYAGSGSVTVAAIPRYSI